MKKAGYQGQPTFVTQESGYALDVQTSTRLIRVSQLARAVRVMLQVKYPMSKDQGLLRRLPRVGFFQPIGY